MDAQRRELERKVIANLDYTDACRLIHMNWAAGVFNLREQANAYGLNYADIWDCANGFTLGRTQTLADAVARAARQENNGAIQITSEEVNLYTNRAGPDSLLREVSSLAQANTIYFQWKISIRNIDVGINAGPEAELHLTLSEDPLYYQLPTLMITGIPHNMGSSNTRGINVRSLDEIPRIIHAMHLIALLIHGHNGYPDNWEQIVAYGYTDIDDIEEVLREMGALTE